jgi:hypothetical protein
VREKKYAVDDSEEEKVCLHFSILHFICLEFI